MISPADLTATHRIYKLSCSSEGGGERHTHLLVYSLWVILDQSFIVARRLAVPIVLTLCLYLTYNWLQFHVASPWRLKLNETQHRALRARGFKSGKYENTCKICKWKTFGPMHCGKTKSNYRQNQVSGLKRAHCNWESHGEQLQRQAKNKRDEDRRGWVRWIDKCPKKGLFRYRLGSVPPPALRETH